MTSEKPLRRRPSLRAKFWPKPDPPQTPDPTSLQPRRYVPVSAASGFSKTSSPLASTREDEPASDYALFIAAAEAHERARRAGPRIPAPPPAQRNPVLAALPVSDAEAPAQQPALRRQQSVRVLGQRIAEYIRPQAVRDARGYQAI